MNSEVGIAIFVYPFASDSVFNFARKLTLVLSEVAGNVELVSGGVPQFMAHKSNIHIHDVGVRLHYLKDRDPRILSLFSWLLKGILVQLLLAGKLLQIRAKVDVIIFSHGYHQVPMIVAKLLGKKVVSTSFGDSIRMAEANYGNYFLKLLVQRLLELDLALSEMVIIESPRIGSDRPYLKNHQQKLHNGALFIERTGRFRMTVPLYTRDKVVGFVGRFTQEKGILEFLSAASLLVAEYHAVSFLIVGSGPLEEEVKELLHHARLEPRVEWIPWVREAEVAAKLNTMKLLVMPSLTEGLPNILLEAIACGTPVLATPVGGVPDLIIDHRTGFLLRDRSPRTIAGQIKYVLNRSDLELQKITESALLHVEQMYSLEGSVRRYRDFVDACCRKT